MNNPFYGYKIFLERRAQKELERFDACTQEKIFEKLDELVAEQHSLNVKKLKGYHNLWRFKFGNYRVVFQPEHNVITLYVICLGTRQGIYQALKKREFDLETHFYD